MKQIIKIVGVLGILGAVYLAPGVKVSAATSCTAWVEESGFTECINGVNYWHRILKRSCITDGSSNVDIQYDNGRYPIGSC